MKTYPQTEPELPLPTPLPRRARGKYHRIITTVREANGEWIAILDPAYISGETNQVKAKRMHGAAAIRGLKIATTCQGGFLYLKLRVEGAEETPA